MGAKCVGIQGHAVAEAPTGVARALLYIVRGSPSFLLLFLLQSIIQAILPYLSSVYEPGSQGIFIEEAIYCIVYSYDRLPPADYKSFADHTSLVTRRVAGKTAAEIDVGFAQKTEAEQLVLEVVGVESEI